MYSSEQDLQSLSNDELITIIQSDREKTRSVKNLLKTVQAVSLEYDIARDKFTSVSPTTTKLLGYDIADWSNLESSKKMLHEDDRDRVLEYFSSKIDSGEDHTIEYKMLKKSGEILWVLNTITFVKNDKGEPITLYSFIVDITKTKNAQLKLEEEHKFLQTIIDSIPDPIMIINRDYSVSLMNKARKKDIKDRVFMDNNSPKCYEISHFRDTPCDGAEHECPLQKTLEAKETTKVIHNHKNPDGSDRFFELSAAPIFDDEYNCTGIIETAVDITHHIQLRDALEESNKNLTHIAHHDYLTELPNRALFMDRLKQTIKNSKRNKTKFALFFMDLDHFKSVNDSFGHDIGDAVLREVCTRFLTCVRENDTLSRLAGDEFTLIMKDIKNRADIERIATKIVATINAPMQIKSHHIDIGTSIGISIFPDDANDADDILQLADKAMYQAKEKGKNRFQFYT